MKNRVIRLLPSLLFTLLLSIGTMACNRGYGCPTNFKLSDLVAHLTLIFGF